MKKTTGDSVSRILRSDAWKASHRKKIGNYAGPRYSPEVNVVLPLAELFEGLTRTKTFYASIGSLRKGLVNALRDLTYADTGLEERDRRSVASATNRLNKVLVTLTKYDDSRLPWRVIQRACAALSQAILGTQSSLRDLQERAKLEQPVKLASRYSADPFDTAIWRLNKLFEATYEIREFSTSPSAVLANAPLLLLNGDAGSGKTHMLCDTIGKHFDEDHASGLLVFGEHIVGIAGIWETMARAVGLERDTDPTGILDALDAAGKSSGCRSLLIVDAINETEDHKIWRASLRRLVSEVKDRKHLALAISVRSGFESLYIRSEDAAKFLGQTHTGFQGREWEAVTTYFKKYSVPLPEIPILSPEFTNPLFLRLFCKAYEKRDGSAKAAFRGHEGSTYIFESYVKAIADNIAKRLGLSKGKTGNGRDYVIWDTVIEKVAARMMETQAAVIKPGDLLRIVKTAHPNTDPKLLVDELESNLLLVKRPHYDSKFEIDGHEYRFPFQRFSDHLIARFLFKSLIDSGVTNPRRHFREHSKWGKYLSERRNRGVVEALAVQAPEWLNGTELFELAPYLGDEVLARTFISSLIWRDPKAFHSDLTKVKSFIRKRVLAAGHHREYLNALVSIAAIENHPFNIEYLHHRLSKMTMPKRDASWTIFLSETYGDEDAVDRLLNWFQDYPQLSSISPFIATALGTLLSWFFTSNQRVLRDRATKSLVRLIDGRPVIAQAVMERFQSVDDSYVLERLTGCVYGLALRGGYNSSEFKKLASWIYKEFFETGVRTSHVLIRSHLRGVVDVAREHYGLAGIDPLKTTPPYGVPWPKKIPSVASLTKKYDKGRFDDDEITRGFLAIWSSLMHQNGGGIADFGNYVVGHAVGRFSGWKLMDQDKRPHEVFANFRLSMSGEQVLSWEAYKESNDAQRLGSFALLIKGRLDPSIWGEAVKDGSGDEILEDEDGEATPGEENVEALRKAFIDSLSSDQRRLFLTKVEPHLDEYLRVHDSKSEFPSSTAQRWIFSRIVKLGWRSELHGRYDKRVQQRHQGRNEHQFERIGKKYQWIAFHEFLGLLADNYVLKDEEEREESELYQGPWQIGNIRDIDPSCLLDPDRRMWPSDLPKFPELGPEYDRWDPQAWANRRIWPKLSKCLELFDETSNSWIVLTGHYVWKEFDRGEDDDWREPRKVLNIWHHSYLASESGKVSLTSALRRKPNRINLPKSYEFYKVLLGEFPDSPAFRYEEVPYHGRDGWMNGYQNELADVILNTDDGYVSTGENSDSSISEAVRLDLPCSWLVREMGLTQAHVDGRFYDSVGTLIAFDPSAFDASSPRILLMNRVKFEAFLGERQLNLVWNLGGEKLVTGGARDGHHRIDIRAEFELVPGSDISGHTRTIVLE